MPIEVAASGGLREMVRLLLEAGADPDPGLRVAAESSYVGIVRLLLGAGADPNPPGNQPLLFTVTDPRVLELLCAHGADLTASDNWGRTVLAPGLRANHHSEQVDQQMLACYQCLLRRGASVEARSKEGRTPIHEAATLASNNATSRQLLALFLAAGGDPNAVDNKGNTPLHYAVSPALLNDYLAKENPNFLILRRMGEDQNAVIVQLVKVSDKSIKNKEGKTWDEMQSFEMPDEEE